MNPRRLTPAGLRRGVATARDYLETWTLVAVLVLSGAAWAFVEIADEVLEGEVRDLDRALLLTLRNPADVSDPIGPVWVEELGRDFTALGGVGVLTLLTLSAAGWLWIMGQRRVMWLLLLSVGGGLLVSSGLKEVFARPRPDLVPHNSAVYTASFPSGHSMMAAVTYLTLGVLLARVQERRLLQVYVVALSVLVTLGVGISRVYTGVHWPTDVLAGWSAGAVWALLCLLVARWLHIRRGARDAEAATR